MEGFETKFWNKTPVKQSVFDDTGKLVAVVAPGDIISLVARSDKNLYAPYAEVIFNRDGSVHLSQRPGWVEAYSKEPWRVELINLDGREKEFIPVAGQVICLPRNISVIRFLSSQDPLAEFSRIEIKLESERVKPDRIPGYYARVSRPGISKTPRPTEDLERIQKERAEAQPAVEPKKDEKEPERIGAIGPAQPVDPSLVRDLGLGVRK
ncbi:MAG: hypothetical protein ABFD52_00645 [Acidobacteriota bacterium]